MAWVVLDESGSGIVKMTDAWASWNVLDVSRYKKAIAQKPTLIFESPSSSASSSRLTVV